MELRSGYKQTEVGVIPEDWGVSTVAAEFSIQLGKMLDAVKNVGVPKPFLGNRAVQWGRIDLTDISEIKLTPYDLQRFRLRDGDLLVCEGGEVGRAAIWYQPLQECYYQKALHRLRPIRGYNVLLMLNMLQRLTSIGFLQNFVTQTSIAHLPKDKFETVPIPIPPTKAEQEAIAEVLSDADALSESLAQLLAKKRRLKQGAMQELLTGKKRLPGFSRKWEARPLRRFVRQFIVPMRDKPTRFAGDIPWCRIEDFEGMYLVGSKSGQCVDAVTVRAMNLKIYPAGTLLVSCSADLGRCAIVTRPLVSNQTFIGLVFDEAVSSNLFFYYFMTSRAEELNNLSSGTTISYLSREQFEEFVVFVPLDRQEQDAIAVVLSDMDADIATLEAQLAKARQLKQGLMQELLTGRIRLV